MEQACTSGLIEHAVDNGFCKMPRYPVINAIQRNSWGHLWNGMGLTLKWPLKIGCVFCSNLVAALRKPIRLDMSCELSAGRHTLLSRDLLADGSHEMSSHIDCIV